MKNRIKAILSSLKSVKFLNADNVIQLANLSLKPPLTKKLESYLHDNLELTHSQYLELISMANGFRNFDTLSAYVKKHQKENIRTLVSYLDEDLGGGLKRGGITTIVVKKNRGLGLVAYSIGANALRQNLKVLHFDLNEPLRGESRNRYVSNLSGVTYRQVTELICTYNKVEISEKDKNKIIDSSNKYSELLLLRNWRDVVPKENRILDTINYCKELKKTFDYDVLILTNIESFHSYSKQPQSEILIERKQIYEDFSSFSQERDCSIVIPISTDEDSSPDDELLDPMPVSSKDVKSFPFLLEKSISVLCLSIPDPDKKEINILIEKHPVRKTFKNHLVGFDFQTINLLREKFISTDHYYVYYFSQGSWTYERTCGTKARAEERVQELLQHHEKATYRLNDTIKDAFY